jgi:hypothetical protein
MRLTSHPAVAKALGMVRAPVPTMRLNMYTIPTWNEEEQHSCPKMNLSPQWLWYVSDSTTLEAFPDLWQEGRQEGIKKRSPKKPGSATQCWGTKH